MNKSWVMVLLAGVLEVIWVAGLKHAENWWMWAATLVALGVSFQVLIRSFSTLPVGTVYAVFTGIGTAGTVIVEMLVFNEPFRWIKVFFILLLLAGVVGLKAITGKPVQEGRQQAS